MDPITALLIFLGVGKLLKSIFGGGGTKEALEESFEAQKERLTHQYEAQQTRIQETATEVSGQQTSALAAMGQAGGEGTVGAGVLAQTEARKSSDLSLLDTSYQDALNDLYWQFFTAVQEHQAEMQFDIEAAIADLANIGLNSQSLGMGGSRAQLNAKNLQGMESRYYSWGLLG